MIRTSYIYLLALLSDICFAEYAEDSQLCLIQTHTTLKKGRLESVPIKEIIESHDDGITDVEKPMMTPSPAPAPAAAAPADAAAAPTDAAAAPTDAAAATADA